MLPFSYESFLTIFFPRNIYIKKTVECPSFLKFVDNLFYSRKFEAGQQSTKWLMMPDQQCLFHHSIRSQSFNQRKCNWNIHLDVTLPGMQTNVYAAEQPGFSVLTQQPHQFSILVRNSVPARVTSSAKMYTLTWFQLETNTVNILLCCWTPRKTKPGPELLRDEMQENH